jgi:hypothetical protein
MSEKDTAQDQARAQVSSICEMVAALECDYDRLEELRDKAAAGHWVAGWNMPGYMPDSEPSAFDTCDEARDYIAEQLQRCADDEDDTSEEYVPGTIEAYEGTAKELREMIGDKDSDYGRTICRFHFWITHIPGKLADSEEQTELDELNDAAGECTSEDEARERIQEDALSVEVRSGWQSPNDPMEAMEFRIVLCTGGPHVELVGDLGDYNTPTRVRVLYSDWGTSGELFDFDRETVLTYCQQFYFGEE